MVDDRRFSCGNAKLFITLCAVKIRLWRGKDYEAFGKFDLRERCLLFDRKSKTLYWSSKNPIETKLQPSATCTYSFAVLPRGFSFTHIHSPDVYGVFLLVEDCEVNSSFLCLTVSFTKMWVKANTTPTSSNGNYRSIYTSTAESSPIHNQ